MNVLILKLNAAGDVVRTTSLLRRLEGSITWVTATENVVLLEGLMDHVRCVSWANRALALGSDYDLLINLEDHADVAAFAGEVRHKRLFGAYTRDRKTVQYTLDARDWFDMSLISVYGGQRADELKYLNRRSYQDLIFEGLGFKFRGEQYVLPKAMQTDLVGDVAIAPLAGPVWPMKTWAFFDQLQSSLEAQGLRVNVLPRRRSLLEHLGDVRNHRCLVGGDSLPMHLALGSGVPCVTLFNCTSPWEIFDYGLQTQLISPLLSKFFYKRGFDPRATTAISIADVTRAVIARLAGDSPASLDL